MELKKRNLIFLGIFLIALVGYVIWSTGWDTIIRTFKIANLGWLFVALLLMILFWLLESSVFHLIVRCFHKKQRFRSSVTTSMIGQLFNCITPFSSGGQPVQAYHMTKTGIPLGISGSCLLIKFIVYQIVLTIYSIVVLVAKWEYFSSQISGFGYLIFIGFLINTGVMFFLFAICFFKNLTQKIAFGVIRLLTKLKLLKHPDEVSHRVAKELTEFHEGFLMLRRHWRMMITTFLLTTCQLTVQFSIPYFLCLTFKIDTLSPTLVICALAFVTMISSFVPLPGASGGAEYSFYTFFSPFFKDTSIINLVLLLWRLLTFYLPIAVGLCFFVFALRKIRRNKKDSSDATIA